MAGGYSSCSGNVFDGALALSDASSLQDIQNLIFN